MIKIEQHARLILIKLLFNFCVILARNLSVDTGAVN